MTSLQKITDGVWIADAPLRFMGLALGSRMTILRTSNDDLVVISPIRLDDELAGHLASLGKVSRLVSPNLFHHLFLGDASTYFPEATVFAPEGLEGKRPDLRIDVTLPRMGTFGGEIHHRRLDGMRVFFGGRTHAINESVFLHRPSKTLVVTDTVFYLKDHPDFFVRLFGRVSGCYDTMAPSLPERWASRDKQAIASSFQQILDWDFDRVIANHGSTIAETNGKEMLRQGYSKFLKIDF